ncbi:MAG: VOC family protein [Candidatus Kapaibacterium sp.]
MGIEIHFWTLDVQRAIDFYTNLLGFNLDFKQPSEGPPDFCIMSLEEATVMFGTLSEVPPSGERERNDAKLWQLIAERGTQPSALMVYITVADVHAHYERSVKEGATVIEPLWDAPWGLTQYSLLDPDGNILTFRA